MGHHYRGGAGRFVVGVCRLVGGVVVGGEMVLVEVISEHYNSIALESKENFATVLGTGVHYFHT